MISPGLFFFLKIALVMVAFYFILFFRWKEANFIINNNRNSNNS